jgi:dihydrofolate reductase
MIVSIIAAMENSGGIGKDGHVPWRLSDDLKLFKQFTMGHHLIVGRVTWESFGRPLQGREMVVVTRQPDYTAPGCQVVGSLEQALDLARWQGESEAFIGGGAQVYRMAMPLVQRIYLTRVHADVPADTFFPQFDESEWTMRESQEYGADENNEYAFTFSVLERGLSD